MIKCPYCFEEFNHDEVHFRSKTVTKGLGDSIPEQYNDLEEFIARYKGNDKNDRLTKAKAYQFFNPVNDLKYTKFWGKYGGINEKDVNEELYGVESYRRRVIEPERDKEYLMQYDKGDYLEFDKEGFTISVKTLFREGCTDRVCPHCHNPLPTKYGKFPIKFISTIGATHSGKTVYLSQLLNNISTITAKVGLAASPSNQSLDLYYGENKVIVGENLPGATPKERLLQPIIINIEKSDEYGRKITETLVIYDIAGENCTSTERLEEFGKFVDNSDGIIILIDPNQFAAINNAINNTDDYVDPLDVLDAIKNHVCSENSYERCEIPIAMCIPKVDIPGISQILGLRTQQYIQNEYKGIMNDQGLRDQTFDTSQYNPVAEELRSLIQRIQNNLDLALYNGYTTYSYFAFTALGCDVQDNKPVGPILPRQIETPLLWLFNQFGYITAAPEKAVTFGKPNLKCPVCGKNRIKTLKGDERKRVVGKIKFLQKVVEYDYECGDCGHLW